MVLYIAGLFLVVVTLVLYMMRDLIDAGEFNKLLKPDSEIMKKADQLLRDKE